MRKGLSVITAMVLVGLGACSSGKQEASPAPTTVDCMTSNAAYAVATTLATVDQIAHAGGATKLAGRKDEDNRLKFKPVPNILRKDWAALTSAFTAYNEIARPLVDGDKPVDEATVEALRVATRKPFEKIALFMTTFCPGPWTNYVKTFKTP